MGRIGGKGRKISHSVSQMGYMDEKVVKMSCCGIYIGHIDKKMIKKSSCKNQTGHMDEKAVKMSCCGIHMGYNKHFFRICPDRLENQDIIYKFSYICPGFSLNFCSGSYEKVLQERISVNSYFCKTAVGWKLYLH